MRAEPAEGVALPQLEDPGDLLTDERLVVGAPESVAALRALLAET